MLSGYNNTKGGGADNSILSKNMGNISEIRRSGSALNTHQEEVNHYPENHGNNNIGSKVAFALKHMSFSNLGADLEQPSLYASNNDQTYESQNHFGRA